MKIKSLNGTRVPHRKNTADCTPKRMPDPAVVSIPMSMHIGRPVEPIVQPGDTVLLGQVIAPAGGPVSAPIHASVSGVVREIGEYTLPIGICCKTVVIESDGKQTPAHFSAPDVTDFASFIQAVRDSGVVGLGGAGFPSSVKLNVAPGNISYVIVNGAECEPYITADTRTMLDDTDNLCFGLRLLHKYYPDARIIVAIENNKPACVEKLSLACADMENTEVRSLPSLYPQGGEKVLIHNITGRDVPEGGLPADVGCIVVNTSSLARIAEYIQTGRPLVEKTVTVDGSAVKNPQNVIVPIGTSVRDLVEFTGGFRRAPKKIILGGPMMGLAVRDLDALVVKNTSAVICLDEADAAPPVSGNCIRCGRCAAHCPLNLAPYAIDTAYSLGKAKRLKDLKANLCIECGCCSFVCPAKRPLVETNKKAKTLLNDYNKALAANAGKEAR